MNLGNNFKEMSILLKLLFGYSAFTFLKTIFDLFQNKPIGFEYFNTGFPNNYPYIWYIYIIFMNIWLIFVFLKRSYSLLVKYFVISLLVGIPGIINMFVNIFNYPEESLPTLLLVNIIILSLGGLLIIYTLKQKKYFNKK